MDILTDSLNAVRIERNDLKEILKALETNYYCELLKVHAGFTFVSSAWSAKLHPCRILQKYATLGESNTRPLTFVKSPSNIVGRDFGSQKYLFCYNGMDLWSDCINSRCKGHSLIREDDETYLGVPGSDFVITRVVFRDNSSKYYINDRTSNFTEVTKMLKGIDLDNNRFLILQGEVEQISLLKPRGQMVKLAEKERDNLEGVTNDAEAYTLKNYHFSNGKRKQQNWLLKIIQLELRRCRRTFLDKKTTLNVKGVFLYFVKAMQEHSAFFSLLFS